jgi:methionyl-tRNA formyltransferase
MTDYTQISDDEVEAWMMQSAIVFFGSGPVAARSLELLHQYTPIKAVITKPQPPHHKEPFPVLEVAERLKLRTFTPDSREELSYLFANKPVQGRLGIVIDYGFIINRDVIEYFPLGIINSHFSLLPHWRGADPISFSILNGDTTTGVSLMLIDEQLDTGKLLAQDSIPIPPQANNQQLTDSLIALSDVLLRKNILAYMNGQLKPYDQDPAIKPTYSRKLAKSEGILDFDKPAEVLEREIRAFYSWPKSRTTLSGKDVVITKAHATTGLHPLHLRGSAFPLEGGQQIGIKTSKGILAIEKLKPAGKPEMTAQAFLAGNKL